MRSDDALIAFTCLVVLLVVGALCWRALRRHALRRARRHHYRRAGQSRPQRLPESTGRHGAITPERAGSIRRDAEQAAQRAVANGSGRSGENSNPHPRGTPEFVLWIATYHLTLTELDEQGAANASSMSRHA